MKQRIEKEHISSVLDLRGSIEPTNGPEDLDHIRQVVRWLRAHQRTTGAVVRRQVAEPRSM